MKRLNTFSLQVIKKKIVKIMYVHVVHHEQKSDIATVHNYTSTVMSNLDRLIKIYTNKIHVHANRVCTSQD